MWNAFRLINSWEVKDMEQSVSNKKSIEWFENKFNQSLANINEQFDKFRISDALMATYKLVWDDFCSWYLELIKPGYEQPIDRITKEKTIEIFENILKLVHPFTPFIAEDLWHLIQPRKEGEDIIVAKWPMLGEVNATVLQDFKITADIIGNIRNVRKENNIANKIKIDLRIATNSIIPKSLDSLIVKMGNLQSLEYTDEKLGNAYSFIVKNVEFFIPFGDNVDIVAEKEKIVEELEYTKGFLNSVRKKLGNTNFVSNAPESVVASEKKKQADAEEKIKLLEQKLSSLN